MKKMIFDEVLNAKLELDRYEDDILVQTTNDNGVLLMMPITWNEYYPISHSLNDDDTAKLVTLLLNATKMFNLLEESTDERAIALVSEIRNAKAF
jgi:hypothetical protein